MVDEVGWSSIAGVVRRWASAKPDAPCLTGAGRTRTWAEVRERSERVAAGLTELGIGPGDRVLSLDKNAPELYELMFGASMVGAVVAAVNWRLAPVEIEALVNHAEARVLVVGEELLDSLTAFASGLTTVKKVLVIGDSAAHESWDAWLARHEPHDPCHPVAPDDVVLQMYTSGTTGLPKGVQFTNDAIAASTPTASVLGVDDASVVLVVLPLFHAGGCTWGLAALALGAHCVIAREVVPEDLVDLVERHRVTETLLAPTVMNMVLGVEGLAARDLSSLRTLAYAASPISAELLRRCLAALPCRFTQIYGMTETLSATILGPEDHDPAGAPELLESAGRAFPGVTVRVVDPATGADRAPGEIGEVWVLAPTNTCGYWRDAAETAKTLTTDGFVRTGDAGCLRDGYLFLRDRVKDMIVSGAENVYPVEVENVLVEHPGIVDVAVIGVPSERWGETVKAVIVPKDAAAPPTAEDVRAFARARLAGYKCPTSIDLVAELPRNASGKILKRTLREPYWQGVERRIG